MLEVKEGQSEAFEAAMKQAEKLIAAAPGFGGIEVRPSADRPDRYLLRVLWEDIAAHRDGFRESESYQEWRALLHHFYEPMPTIEYFRRSIV